MTSPERSAKTLSVDLGFWGEHLSDEEREVVRRGRYGRRHELGRRPALLLVDLQFNYLGADRPILDQIDEHRSGVGERGWRAAERIKDVLAAARDVDIPVLYTVVKQRRSLLSGRNSTWGMIASLDRPTEFMTDQDPGSRIPPDLSPDEQRGEVVLTKSYPSAFFATPLTSYLVNAGVDTVLIAGGTTSGCVRATAVDGASLNFRVGVIADCVFDRLPSSHASSLLDIWMKYGTVVDSSQALAYLTGNSVTAE